MQDYQEFDLETFQQELNGFYLQLKWKKLE